MSEKVELELKIKGGTQAVKTLGQLEQELNNARDAIKEVEVGSDAFKELASKIQNTSSEVKTLEKQMEGLEPQQKAEAFLKMGEGIAGGFAVAQGAMGLMGVESENLEKIQVKVQSAIAIAQGVRMMSEAALMFTTAKRVAMEKIAVIQGKIGIVVMKASALATTLYTATLKSVGIAANVSTKGMKALRTAIASTGIGLVVIAIGALVAYWDDIKAAVSGVSTEMKEQLKLSQEAKVAAIKNMEANEGSVNQLKLAGKSQKEIIELKQTDIKAAILASEIELERQKSTKKAQIETAQRNKDITQGLLKILMLPMEAIVGLYNEIVYYLPGVEAIASPSEWLAGKIFDPAQTEIEVNATTNEMEKGIATLKEKYAGLQLSLNDLNNNGTNNRSETTKEQQAKALEELESFLTELQTTNDDYLQTAEQKEVNAVLNKYERLINEAEKYGLDTAQLKEQQEAIIKEIEDRYTKERTEKQIELNQNEIDSTQAVTDAKIMSRDQLTNAVKGSIGELGNLFKEGSKAAKTAALTEVAINTALGFVQGLDIAQKSAKATGPGAAVAFPIFYATQIGAVLSAANKAKGILGGGGGDTPPDNPDTPDNLEPATTGAFSLGGGMPDQQAVKAYVVTDEMSNSQEQLSDIRRRSTI